MPPRLGVFGGTFDPPHIGHLVAAVNARYALGLDRVLFVVANEPWQKVGARPVSPAAVRLEMVRAAVEGVEGLEPSDLEIKRGGPSYTVDTLDELASMNPGCELFLILGWDAASSINTWERAERLASLASIVVVDRPHSEPLQLPTGWTWTHVDIPQLDISSTDLRRRVGEGRPIDFLVPPGVISCIAEHCLYRDELI
ncbi:MAG: nicotinate-nucleotide adenylyltransferase [Acidimicrobiales bacterium]|nr:nicotinate-nucleotide adenylyltransferase [Acidimicrobiales bacterium]